MAPLVEATGLEAAVLWAHIIAGVIALLAGTVALATTKGNPRHKLAGRTFVRAMAVVVGSVFPLLAFEPGSFLRQLLVLVAVFSGYFAFSGYRVLARKRPAAEAHAIDWVVAGLTVLVSLALAGWGGSLLLKGTNLGLVMLVFGVTGVAFAGMDLRQFQRGEPEPWMLTHLSRMMGAFIATITAVSVVNFADVSAVPDVVAWLWPTAVGVPLIWYFLAKYRNAGPLTGMLAATDGPVVESSEER